MLIAVVLAVLVAGVVLTRALWRSPPADRNRTLLTIAAAVLVGGLILLAASGRLNWIAALVAALLPFLRRGLGLLRHLPLLGSLWQTLQRSGRASGATGAAGGGTMSIAQAREILGIGPAASRQEVIDAHRRLIQKLHPDRGGSTFLAQQINEAKRVLLEAL